MKIKLTLYFYFWGGGGVTFKILYALHLFVSIIILISGKDVKYGAGRRPVRSSVIYLFARKKFNEYVLTCYKKKLGDITNLNAAHLFPGIINF